jgi:hypothetical protein
MKFRRSVAKRLNWLASAFGLEVREKMPDFYLHKYASYEEYRATQIFHNKRKIDKVWADESTLSLVAERVRKEFPGRTDLFALCHGTRNGFEQNFLAGKLTVDITGTDISETAKDYPLSVQWDFHDRNEAWVGRCDFIYTNSLDQSWKPDQAVGAWLDQLKQGGLLFIEHTMDHSPQGAGEMDPFGANPHYMPYLLSEWFGHRISIEVITSHKSNTGKQVWLFVLRKN